MAATKITIASGATQSGAFNVETQANTIVGLETPQTVTSADLNFQVKSYDGNWKDLYGIDGTLMSISISGNRFYALDPSAFIGVNQIRVVSSVAQGQDTDFYIITEII